MLITKILSRHDQVDLIGPFCLDSAQHRVEAFAGLRHCCAAYGRAWNLWCAPKGARQYPGFVDRTVRHQLSAKDKDVSTTRRE
jgi:hypothetical protein